MPSASELRAELKALRTESKEHHPISKMKKADLSEQIERLKKSREETPAPAAVPSVKTARAASPAKKTLKAAKETEFPHSQKPHLAQHHGHEEKHNAGAPKSAPKKKAAMTKAMLRAMLDDMSSDEE